MYIFAPLILIVLAGCLAEQVYADFCSLPVINGPCRGRYLRFYFNKIRRTCDPFYYGGCQGNGNNFETIEECNAKCVTNTQIPDTSYNVCTLPKVMGPCKSYLRRYYYNSQNQQCELFTFGGCQGNGNNFHSLSECQSKCGSQDQVSNFEDICSLPKKVGPCKAAKRRFYYDNQKRQCLLFIYGGCQGNDNNFVSVADCQNKCPNQKPISNVEVPEFNPCKQGSPLKNFNTGKQIYCKYPEMTCPNNYECIYNIADAPAVCCPPNKQISFPGNKVSSNICNLPMKSGPCLAAFRRYYFNTTKNICEEFTWGGCAPNANNFGTLEECRSSCMKQLQGSSLNPCHIGKPLIDRLTKERKTCGFNKGSCPTGYTCNSKIANRPAVCCRST